MKKTDKINKEVIEKLNPCRDRFNNFLNHYPNFNDTLEEFILLDDITYSDKIWVVTRLFTKEQNVKVALACANKVLSMFESKYPNDLRPRQALEAAEAYINNPCEETKAKANADANAANATANATAKAAHAAAYAAANATAKAAHAAAHAANAAAYAAHAAAYSAANATAKAAHAAAYAANAAAYSAANAAFAAAHAANAAANAFDIEQEVNLILMAEVLNETN